MIIASTNIILDILVLIDTNNTLNDQKNENAVKVNRGGKEKTCQKNNQNHNDLVNKKKSLYCINKQRIYLWFNIL